LKWEIKKVTCKREIYKMASVENFPKHCLILFASSFFHLFVKLSDFSCDESMAAVNQIKDEITVFYRLFFAL